MKSLSLIINAVLAVAIAVLFYFQFSADKGHSSTNSVNPAVIDSVSSSLKIAFVNTDTLWVHYKLINDLQSDLETARAKSERKMAGRSAVLEKQLKQMSTDLQNKAADFQQNADGMNELLRNTKMQELQDLQQNAQAFSSQADQELSELGQSLQAALQKQEQTGTNRVNKNIKEFLQTYNSDYGFSYVLAYADQAGGILLGNPALDITKDVTAGLNAIYDEEQAAKKSAKK